MDTKERVALLSVYDKTGIVKIARRLKRLDFRLLASGGTKRAIAEARIDCEDVADLVGGEAILGHRVVTLSREVHAGLLARAIEEDLVEMEQLGLPCIDLVYVNPYPLEAAIADPEATEESITEMTDIGGPAMLRSGAKGRRLVTSRYDMMMKILDWLERGEPDGHEEEGVFERFLASRAEGDAANYGLTSARVISDGQIDGVIGEFAGAVCYPENKWQTNGGLFQTLGNDDPLAIANFQQVAGDLPSTNNLCDLDRLTQTITHIMAGLDANFGMGVTCVAIVVKHGNPCGVGVDDHPKRALEKMIDGNPRAMFGGVVMTSFFITEDLAETLAWYNHNGEKKRVVDGIAAPKWYDAAFEVLERAKGKCRMFENPALGLIDRNSLDTAMLLRPVRGGFLRQTNYTHIIDLTDFELIGPMPGRQARRDVAVAWGIGSTSNSNTITLVRNGMLLGNGVGQQDRVGAAELAIKIARENGHDLDGAVAYSDSFFPFPDGLEVLADAGVRTVYASSGSVGDEAVAKAARNMGITLIRQPDEDVRGFYRH